MANSLTDTFIAGKIKVAINTLKPRKAQGPDHISLEFIINVKTQYVALVVSTCHTAFNNFKSQNSGGKQTSLQSSKVEKAKLKPKVIDPFY